MTRGLDSCSVSPGSDTGDTSDTSDTVKLTEAMKPKTEKTLTISQARRYSKKRISDFASKDNLSAEQRTISSPPQKNKSST